MSFSFRTEFGISELTQNGRTYLCLPMSDRDSVNRIREGVGQIRPGKVYDVEIKEVRKRRSLEANGYFWVLAEKLAIKLRTTKEQVYRKAIKDVGVFEIVPVREDAAQRWIENWQSKGLGWVCEDLGDSKLDGYKRLICYFGSSTFDSKEMARLIDWIVEECKEQGIEVMDPEEINSLVMAWGVSLKGEK